VEAYKRALGLDPRDQRAKWNLEIALRKQKDEEEKKKKDDENKDKQKNDDQKKDQDKDDKKDQNKDDKNKKDDKKDQKQDQKQDQKKDQQKADEKGQQPPPPKEAADQKEIEAVLDSLEKSPKDLEKERARIRAVRRRPPARDW
jgi:Ca-activated chloride channel homolog